MSDYEITGTRILAGRWEGVLTGPDTEEGPGLLITKDERAVEGAELLQLENAGTWLVRVPIPAETLSEGIQTFLIADAKTGDHLASFNVVVGDSPGMDMRAEIDLLRAELDMLKKAFRRHCVETGND